MNTVFEEIQMLKRLIEDNRQTLYSLQTHCTPNVETLIREKKLIVKSLELYLDVLEKTVNARSRSNTVVSMETRIHDSREKN